jgi:crotonobetainyl-CoA:carnitine CoA-transferase CaiB-like acyl-CoA transferase
LLSAEQANASDDDAAVLLQAAVGALPAAEVFSLLDDAGVPVEIVNETFCREIFDDPELQGKQWVARTWAGGVGVFEDPGLLVEFSENPCSILRGPSRCGQHTREIMLELGYSNAEIDASAAEKAVLDLPIQR